MKLHITENQLPLVLEGYYDKEVSLIMPYIKSFGQKGKLPAFNGNLSDCYKDSAKQAYKWAYENDIENVRSYGDAWFFREFSVEVAGRFTLNKRGLIYVERSIDLDVSKGFDNLGFKSIGECWSWKRLNSRSYCTEMSPYDRSTVRVILCGYVHPNSVDWVETIYLNSYRMKNETEIRMNDNALVEVSYIRVGNEKYYLGGSYLINASSDKYRNKDW